MHLSVDLVKSTFAFVFIATCISCSSIADNKTAENVTGLEDISISTKDGDFNEVPTDIAEIMLRKDQGLKELVMKIPEIRWMVHYSGNNKIDVPYYKEVNYGNNMLNQCNTDLLNLTLSITQNWTLNLIDSFGKLPSGVLKGDLFWPGDFDECRSFASPKTVLFPDGLHTRYCLMSLGSRIGMTSLTIGICVPKSCGTNELNEDFSTLSTLLSKVSHLEKYHAKLPNVTFNCLPENVPLNSAAIGCVVFLVIVLGLSTAGTLFDVFEILTKSKKSVIVIDVPVEQSESIYVDASADDNFINGISDNKINEDDKTSLVPDTSTRSTIVGEILLSFSAIKNGQAILDTSNRPGQLNCIHGIRFISMTWVILGHTYVFGLGQIANLLDVFNQLKTWPFQAIENATFSVDTFFLLSGFLVAYLFLKESSNLSLKKLGYFYLHRYIRLTPVYMAVLFVFATLFNFIGDGPYWNYAVQQENQCTKYWWRNLLYLINFFPSTDMCMAWAWYLANDMQFFVISPLFLIFLKSSKTLRRWIGFSIIVVLLFTSWIYTGIFVKVKNLPILLNAVGEGTDAVAAMAGEQEMFDEIYIKPWTRIGPYLIGSLTAFVLINFSNSRRILTPLSVIVCWCAALALALIDVYGLYNAKLTITMSAFYNALSRSAWALAVAWVILACLTGNGGIVNRFLSWKFWFPLSRLTYCAYLTHPLVLYFYFQTLRAPIYLSNVVLSIHYIGFVALSYGVAFVISITLEAPVIKLEKLIRQKLSK